ncbi:hybrid sensor histidine kinase/response regulator [Pseudomonas sp. Os17]|uniref:hybrid sensor histidine kinase/response regulator n=1 Tax=Pseudomonas sp. Os17 TaxID=1500686 RepID=UPI000AE8AEA9|nr:hybrid sensor histidine kinase/response regulator [Pseudomonas sp. Os17]
MPDIPLRRIAQNFRRLNLVLFVILPLLLIMGGALFWGGQRIIRQEQERIAVDFKLLTRYMGEQKALLERLKNEPFGDDDPQSTARIFRLMDEQQALGATLFQGSPSPVETPFTLVCEDMLHCPLDSARAASFGRYLADLYSSFWVRSSYPASALLVVDAGTGSSFTVPTVGAHQPSLSAAQVMASIQAIRNSARGGGNDEVRWIRLPGFAGHLLAFKALRNPRFSNGATDTGTYAATLSYRQRIDVFSRPRQPTFYDAFWLESPHDGLLLGERPQPADMDRAVNLRSDGLVFRVSDDSATWTGYYLLSYRTLFLGHSWPLAGILLLLVLSPVAGRAYARWYQRRVIVPAQRAHSELVESDQFNRTLLETTPVALCVLRRERSLIVFANTLALKWFDTQVGQSLQDSGLEPGLLEQISQAREPGEIENYQSHDGRSFYIAYAPTRYRNQDVLVCAFADLSVRAQMEQQLTQAKQAADKANGAKSVFLATMSHEIRTPLYGVLGSLELMGLTDLDREQRQLLERIQVSSGLLLQIISDILDITRIESGQLSLGDQPFDPRALVQRCTAAFVDAARNKGLLLFASVDPALPPLLGDPGRISQILTNLISNAVKFTHSGHVIVRARSEPGSQGRVRLSLQVVDTGIGIGQEEQQQLFIPFYQIDAHSHTVHGAGLGLSICARLAALMGSQIHLTSELGLGSSFTMSLELPVADEVPDAPVPDLGGTQIHVHSPHHELTDNLCLWLQKWGAQASPLDAAAATPHGEGILLRLLDNGPQAPSPATGLLRIDLGGQHQAPGTSLAEACDFMAIGRLIERRLRRAPEPSEPSPSDLSGLPALGLNVLVAEDNPINQATLSHQLQQLGCRNTLAADGAEALDLWRVGDYDLLLTDVNMPRMNGYELTCILRASGDDRPIIGITANAMCDEEARCQAAGMDTWLVKPVPLQTLRASLARLTQVAPEDDQDPLPDAPTPPDSGSLPPNLRQIFTHTMKLDLEHLRRALDQHDYERIFHLLHRIRGSLAVAGYEPLIQQLEALGQSLREAGLTATTRTNSLTLLHALQDISQPD